MSTKGAILIVEDEAIAAMNLEAKIKELGYEIAGTVFSGEAAIDLCRGKRPQLVLMDIRLQGEMDGIEAARHIYEQFDIPTVFLTAYSDEETVNRAREVAPFGYLTKPLRDDILKTTIAMALAKHSLEKKLVDSNQELERFAYIAAHDLKAPIRQIYLWLQLLLEEMGPKLDEKSREYIELAHTATKRMQTLIDNLLEYSLLTAKPPVLTPVDLDAVVGDALNSLRVEIDKRGAKIERGRLPVVMGNAVQLQRLLENLLLNAMKYNKEKPEISIFHERSNQHAVISVKDNGIGIPPEDTERIFDMFRRLHSQSEIPGTGIGLASCRKIVELHGGKIWVNSKVGQGSTFNFTLLTA